jgi:hypothetical protein
LLDEQIELGGCESRYYDAQAAALNCQKDCHWISKSETAAQLYKISTITGFSGGQSFVANVQNLSFSCVCSPLVLTTAESKKRNEENYKIEERPGSRELH